MNQKLILARLLHEELPFNCVVFKAEIRWWIRGSKTTAVLVFLWLFSCLCHPLSV